ncbi:trigger factor [Candidatus Uhrbacteria bacterium RIFCSPHIGHO2_01_FULL_63_20]|uniref:Trigger factor n=1 Tax=Candidatus Uhrbacteria bacterium RIFCSPHIGHO2_01_FULL_63_20 TaxID=1802385 RepID=A0A1F7TNB3_9BACT|nr:MAG: trigger factor [Candidatus Uhrbacteria bacterium RIFCSPHIGHO2_01_FULL_63_20]
MPSIQVENLPKNTVKITVTVSQEELQPHLGAAATALSEETSIPGFRPGKAGFDIVKNRVGEMKIYEAALEPVVRATLFEAFAKNDLETVGSPKIDVVKLAPGNDLVYTAEVARMPAVTKLADHKKLSVKSVRKPVEEKDVDVVLKDLSRMQTKEVRAVGVTAAGGTDKAVVAMNMKKDGVPVEGGQSPNHIVLFGEDYYVPGFKEQVSGMKEGEQKTFTLKFPAEHASKLLAGSDVEFDVTLNELYHLESPTPDDAFAKSLGQTDLATLRGRIKENLAAERAEEEGRREEREVLELIAKESRFDDIPDLLVNEEVNKMLHELEHNVTGQGLDFDKYLEGIKKGIAQLKLEFAPQALVRIKVALIVKELAKQLTVTVDEKDVDDELDRLAENYEDAEAKKRLYSPAYREYVTTVLKNRKVVQELRKTMVK